MPKIRHSSSHVESLPDLVTALARFVDSRIEAKLGRSAGGDARFAYSQIDGERPTGAGREKYRAVFRRALAEKDPGAKKQGRALVMSEACWLRWVDALPSRKAKAATPVSAVSLDDQVLDELRGRKAS